MTKVLRGLFILILVGIAGVGASAFYLSGLLLFRDKPRSDWATVKTPQCSTWLETVAYADLREGAPRAKPIDLSCEEGTRLEHSLFSVKAITGMDIAYKVYKSALPSPEAPLFLHVHGVSGNSLHGARYLKMAERLGFQLVAMDLSNHGESQRDGKGAAYGCREEADVVAVVEDLLRRFPGRDLYLHASSMGAMSLTNALPRLLASEATAAHIVAVSLENPISSVRDVVTKSPLTPPVPGFLLDMGILVAGWRAGYNFDTCRPIDNAKFVRVPVLVQWSEKDDLVPRAMIEDFFAALPSDVPRTLEIFPGGGHSAVWNGNPTLYEEQTAENWRKGVAAQAERKADFRP
ncbi:MAG: alpha/beta fold hydrolase [Silvanigrellales bacterium]|jgi:pimeloyl-ACP methyl ester carboxylesterase|nr:alpha/beta fold hydrolase [Silvanigrellales bacterium]